MSEGMSETQPKQADTELEALSIEGLTTGENILLSADFWTELKQEAVNGQPGKVRRSERGPF
jgi:hypothetical protein